MLFRSLLMRLASKLLQRGLKMPVLFIVSLSALGLRILLLAVLHSMAGVMATQVLMSIGFAGFLRFNVDYVASLFSRQYAGRAILISVAVTQGIGSIVGNLAGGYLLANVGVPIYCLICGSALLLALVIFNIYFTIEICEFQPFLLKCVQIIQRFLFIVCFMNRQFIIHCIEKSSQVFSTVNIFY